MNILLLTMKPKIFNKIILSILFFAITPVFGGLCITEIFHNHDHDTNYVFGSKLKEKIKSDDCSKVSKFFISDISLKNGDQENKNDQAYYGKSFVFDSEIIKNCLLNIVFTNPPSPPHEKEMLAAIFKKE